MWLSWYCDCMIWEKVEVIILNEELNLNFWRTRGIICWFQKKSTREIEQCIISELCPPSWFPSFYLFTLYPLSPPWLKQWSEWGHAITVTRLPTPSFVSPQASLSYLPFAFNIVCILPFALIIVWILYLAFNIVCILRLISFVSPASSLSYSPFALLSRH